LSGKVIQCSTCGIWRYDDPDSDEDASINWNLAFVNNKDCFGEDGRLDRQMFPDVNLPPIDNLSYRGSGAWLMIQMSGKELVDGIMRKWSCMQ
jgi:hypothetical protein